MIQMSKVNVGYTHRKAICSWFDPKAPKLDEDSVDEKLGLFPFTMHTIFDANIKLGNNFVWL